MHNSYITVLLHKCFYGRAGAQPYRLLNIHIDEHKGEEMGHKIGWGPYPLTLGVDRRPDRPRPCPQQHNTHNRVLVPLDNNCLCPTESVHLLFTINTATNI